MNFATEDTIKGFWEEGYISSVNIHNNSISKSEDEASTNTFQVIELINRYGQKFIHSLNFKQVVGTRKGVFYVDILKNEFIPEEEISSLKEEISKGVKDDIEHSLLFTINEVEFLDIMMGENVINCGESFCEDFKYKENAVNPYCLKIKNTFCSSNVDTFFKNLPFFYAKKKSFEVEDFIYYYFKDLANTTLTDNLKHLSKISKLLINNGVPSEIEFNFS